MIEVATHKAIDSKLEQEILTFTDNWLRSEFANKVLDCTCKMQAKFENEDHVVFLKLSMFDYSDP